jgi:hypothetical protein
MIDKLVIMATYQDKVYGGNVAIIADGAIDLFVLPVNRREFARFERLYNEEIPNASEILDLAKHLGTTIESYPGGPALTIGQHFAVRKTPYGPVREVSAVLLTGDGEDTTKYLRNFENLDIETRPRIRSGLMPRCIYVLNPEKNQDKKELPPAWEGNVTDKEIVGNERNMSYRLSPDFIRLHDTIILSSTHPQVAKRAINYFRGQLSVYSPGPIFDYTPFEETLFPEIIKKANYLAVNRKEARNIMGNMGYSELDRIGSLKKKADYTNLRKLFDDYPNSDLELIIMTMGAKGSFGFHRDGDSYMFNLSKVKRGKVNSRGIKSRVGAGDRHLAATVIGIWNHDPLDKILHDAAFEAQKALLHTGAIDPRLIEVGGRKNLYPGVTKILA